MLEMGERPGQNWICPLGQWTKGGGTSTDSGPCCSSCRGELPVLWLQEREPGNPVHPKGSLPLTQLRVVGAQITLAPPKCYLLKIGPDPRAPARP